MARQSDCFQLSFIPNSAVENILRVQSLRVFLVLPSGQTPEVGLCFLYHGAEVLRVHGEGPVRGVGVDRTQQTLVQLVSPSQVNSKAS